MYVCINKLVFVFDISYKNNARNVKVFKNKRIIKTDFLCIAAEIPKWARSKLDSMFTLIVADYGELKDSIEKVCPNGIQFSCHI